MMGPESQQGRERKGAPTQTFQERLKILWARENFVCVGLDSDYSQIPESVKIHYGGRRWDMFFFNKAIVEATNDLVCAYKPNAAFYEAEGDDGLRALKDTIDDIHGLSPIIPVILDAKRGDIGNTNLGYVKAAFDDLGADAITVHPTLGSVFFEDQQKLQLEALAPFLSRKDKGILVLCRTSNKSAGEFQDLPVELTKLSNEYKSKFGDLEELREIVGQDIVPLYLVTAFRVAKYWNINGNVGLVVGATYPGELAQVRKIVGDMTILIPGIGAQGAEVEATITAGKDSHSQGMIINSSRAIIFASKGEDYAEAARKATQSLREEINRYR